MCTNAWVQQRRFAPAVQRNRQAIFNVLEQFLQGKRSVLEVASGTGEHIVYFATKLPNLTWQPSELDPVARKSISAWKNYTGANNVRSPIELDVRNSVWPDLRVDAVLAINMIHISPWESCIGLFVGAKQVLTTKGLVIVYGPYKQDGRHISASNEAFDQQLRQQNPLWGVRDLNDVDEVASKHCFSLVKRIQMPVHNLSMVYQLEN